MQESPGVNGGNYVRKGTDECTTYSMENGAYRLYRYISIQGTLEATTCEFFGIGPQVLAPPSTETHARL